LILASQDPREEEGIPVYMPPYPRGEVHPAVCTPTYTPRVHYRLLSLHTGTRRTTGVRAYAALMHEVAEVTVRQEPLTVNTRFTVGRCWERGILLRIVFPVYLGEWAMLRRQGSLLPLPVSLLGNTFVRHRMSRMGSYERIRRVYVGVLFPLCSPVSLLAVEKRLLFPDPVILRYSLFYRGFGIILDQFLTFPGCGSS